MSNVVEFILNLLNFRKEEIQSIFKKNFSKIYVQLYAFKYIYITIKNGWQELPW